MMDMSSNETKIPLKYSIPFFLALIIAGLAGNYFRYPIFLNIDFLFGSIFAMLALQFFGLGRGIVAAALIASYTYILWNHPYAIIIQTVEVMIVGWLFGRRKFGLVMADVVFWLIIGMPLVYFFYHVVMHIPPSNAYLTMTKQAINGISNVLLARLIYYGYAFSTRKTLISYREIVYNLLAFFVLCPCLILLMISSRNDFAETDRRIKSLLIENIEHEDLILDNWAESRKSAVVTIADMAATRSPQQMQIHLEQAAKSDKNFLRIGLLDKGATTTAYFPLLDENGQKNLGKNFADRPFIPVLKSTLKPLLSEVVMGKMAPNKPIVTMLAPVVIGGEYGGYVTGVLNLNQIKLHLDKSMNINNTFYALLDKNGLVIMTNRTDQKVMTSFNRGKGELRILDNRVSQWVPPLPANTPTSERWKKSFYVTEAGIGSLDEWKLILEQPVAPFQKSIFDNYTGKLCQLFIILLGSLALAEFLSRRFLSTQERLQQITRGLPQQIAMGSKIDWQESVIEEASQLINNFKETAESLASQFYEIQQINDSLEKRVEVRTLELLESKHFLSDIIENNGALIYVKDREGRYELVNQMWEDVTGINRNQAIGKRDIDLFPDTIANGFRANDCKVLELSSIVKSEENFEAATGMRTFYSIKFPLMTNNGEIRGVCGMSAEITDQKRSEIALRESEVLFRTLSTYAPVGIFRTDPEGNCIYVNNKWCEIAGLNEDEALGSGWIMGIHPEDRDKVFTEWRGAIKEKRAFELEYRFVTPVGKITWVNGIASALISTSNEITGFIGSITDISERLLQEEEKLSMERHFQQTQRLESLGVLAGGIAHDFNNILAIIMGNCALAKMDPEMFESNLSAIEKASERAAALCRQMLEYAGHTQIAKSKVDMESVVLDMVEMLSSTGRKNVTIKPVVTPNIPFIYGDISQIRQIAMNLIINATEAIGDVQGEIDVMLTKITINSEQSEKDHLGRVIPAGKYVCLEVTDNGCGMDDETKLKVFEPFYTTKFTGRGLGLSATLGIISGHDGALQLFSQPGKGTTFKVYLPAQTSDSIKEDKQTDSVPWQGSGTILLVEDEDQVRMIAKTILKKFGFTVIDAVNGKEALELFQQNTGKISLVITDIGMPIMDGYELFFELKKIKPELPIIISSGFGDKDIGSKIPQENMAGLLSKPFNPTQLQELLKKVLEDTSNTGI